MHEGPKYAFSDLNQYPLDGAGEGLLPAAPDGDVEGDGLADADGEADAEAEGDGLAPFNSVPSGLTRNQRAPN